MYPLGSRTGNGDCTFLGGFDTVACLTNRGFQLFGIQGWMREVLTSTCLIPAEAFSGTLSLLSPSQVSPKQPALAATHVCPGNTSQLLGFIPNRKSSGDFQGLDTPLLDRSHRFTGAVRSCHY
jgi:hypothetical protein